MNIFQTTVPTQIGQFSIDDAYRLKTAFQEALDAVKEAQAALDKADQAAKRVGGFTAFRLERASEADIAEAFWTAVLRSLPVRKAMSHQQQEDMEKWVGSQEYRSRGSYPRWYPEFIIPNIMQIAEMYEERHAFFLRNWALTVYRHFVGYPEEPHEIHIPNKIKASGYVDSQGVKFGWHIRFLADLDRLFYYLDGRALEEPFNQYESPLIAAIREAVKRGENSGETDYFHFRFYTGNGNLNLAITRRDLVSAWEDLAREGMAEQMR